jgi:hypothetical protein
MVFGERRWERRRGGDLEATPAAPFDRTPLSFAQAFGGGYDLPPGLLPGSDLPHPGVRVGYPLNEGGVGYYPDERAATGGMLPSIERPDQLVKRWNDAPEPAGFTPCPNLLAWRMKGAGFTSTDDVAALIAQFLRMQHHAPPSLIFDDVPAGRAVELHGLGASTLRFTVPPAPTQVTTVRGRRVETAVPPRLRALHVDADDRAVHFVFAHTFRYEPADPPRWIRVADA